MSRSLQLTHDERFNPALPKLGYSRVEAANVLGISPRTVDRLTQRGLLRPSRAIGRPIYSLKELERFLEETSEPAEVA